MADADDTLQRNLADFTIRLVDAWGDAVAAHLDRMLPFMESIAKVAEDPQVRAAVAARQFSDAVREYKPCHCLCGHVHPGDKGVCDTNAAGFRRYVTPSLGKVDVALCAPCAAVQGIADASGPAGGS